MKRFSHVGFHMSPYASGEFVRYEDVQQLAREVLPCVEKLCDVLRGLEVTEPKVGELFDLRARLSAIAGEA